MIAIVAAAGCGADNGDGGGSSSGGTSGGTSSGNTPKDPQSPDNPDAPVIEPDGFADGENDVVTNIKTKEERKPISPLIYGLNGITPAQQPPEVLAAVSFVRRGGDRGNAYNWENNVSNGAFDNNWANDLYLAETLPNTSDPAAVDIALLKRNRAGGRATMVPFVLNDYVSGPVSGNIPWDKANWLTTRAQYFKKVGLVKPTAFTPTPNLSDNMVYTDEHLQFLRDKFPGEDIMTGPNQLLVGIDNEPDLYHYNFPMLQEGRGEDLFAESSGVKIGKRVPGDEFTERFLKFAKRVKEMAANATIVGPSHYHYDGFQSWHSSMPQYTDDGRWYMDDFLQATKKESEATGKRLLDIWDFHWYPQTMSRGTYVWDLDDSVRKLTPEEITEIVQGPRSYWDKEYDEKSWITTDHLRAPAFILLRLLERINKEYPGTKLGVSEYFPGGCAHISSGIATADSLGIFARQGVALAALWPTCGRLEFAHAALKLMRNADGKQLRYAETDVKVEHPEKVESSVYASTDSDSKRVTMLVINKQQDKARKIGLRLFHTAQMAKVAIYRIDADHSSPNLVGEESLAKKNAFSYEAPPMTASLLVFRAP
jgi:mannan endo-1,4-beta-mannosidase